MKKELRKTVIAERVAMSGDSVNAKSQKISEELFSLPEYQASKFIMLYLDFRNEVQTEKIIKEAKREGKKIAIPVTLKAEGKIIPVELKNYPEDLEKSTYGILEPKKDKVFPVEFKEIDLVLLPGVAFDLEGYRLGYGAGYYDRFLPQLESSVPKIALAFELQIRENVFPESHDQKADKIITEERIIEIK